MAKKQTEIPLTPMQQKVSAFVDSASKDPAFPEITDVRRVMEKTELEIPKGVSRGPEYDYCWLSIDNLDGGSLITSGGKWEIVTRSNHSHVQDRLFGLNGGITYKGQNILAFTLRSLKEAEEKSIINDYNQKAQAAKHHSAIKEGGKVSIEEMDKNEAGRVVDGFDLATDQDYDFAETA